MNFKDEAARANLKENNRILKWRPFWNKVYRGEDPPAPPLRPLNGYGLKGTFSKVTQNTPTFLPIYLVIKLKETESLERV